MGSKLTILFSGMIAADPFQGGATWAMLQCSVFNTSAMKSILSSR